MKINYRLLGLLFLCFIFLSPLLRPLMTINLLPAEEKSELNLATESEWLSPKEKREMPKLLASVGVTDPGPQQFELSSQPWDVSWTCYYFGSGTEYKWELWIDEVMVNSSMNWNNNTPVTIDLSNMNFSMDSPGTYNVTIDFIVDESAVYYHGIRQIFVTIFENEVFIEQEDYYIHYEQDEILLNWTAFLPSGYSPSWYYIYRNGTYQTSSSYSSGQLISHNITSTVNGGFLYNYTAVFTGFYSGNYFTNSSTIWVYVIPTNSIFIDQKDGPWFFEGELMELEWTCYLPTGYTTFQYELYRNGFAITSGSYNPEEPVILDVSSYVTGGNFYNFTMSFQGYDDLSQWFEKGSTIWVQIHDEPWLDHIPYIEMAEGEGIFLEWTPYLPPGYSTFQYELYQDGSFLLSGGYTPGEPVKADISSFVTDGNLYNFTMNFQGYDDLSQWFEKGGTIWVNVTGIARITIDQVDSVTYIEGEGDDILDWTAHLPTGWTPLEWQVLHNGTLAEGWWGGSYSDGSPVHFNITHYLYDFLIQDESTCLNMTAVFVAKDPFGMNQSAYCSIFVSYIDRGGITIEQIDSVTVYEGESLILNWTVTLDGSYLPNGGQIRHNFSPGGGYSASGTSWSSGAQVSWDATYKLTTLGWHNFTAFFWAYLISDPSIIIVSNCIIWVYVIPSDTIFIEQKDSISFIDGDSMELEWTCYLPPGYSTFEYQLYKNGSSLRNGSYTPGEPVVIDISSYVAGNNFYDFAIVFMGYDALSQGFEEWGSIWVTVTKVSTDIEILQVDNVTIIEGDELWLNWTATLPPGFTESQWELLVNGSLKDSNSSWTSGTPLYVLVTAWITGPGIYNFTCVFRTNEGLWGACTIIAIVHEAIKPIGQISIEQMDNITIVKGEELILNWTATISGIDFAATQWELSIDGLFVNNGSYDNGTTVFYNVTNLILTLGKHNFTMVFWANVSSFGLINASCTIIIFVLDSAAPTEMPIHVTVVTPSTNETVAGYYKFSWLINHTGPLAVELYVSSDNETWTLIKGTSETNFLWDTTNKPDGTYYFLVRIVATGYVGEATAQFQIKNLIVEDIPAGTSTFMIAESGFQISLISPATLTIEVITEPASSQTPPASLNSIGIYLKITLSDPSALNYLSIELDYSGIDLRGQNSGDLAIYYYNETKSDWVPAEETSVDTVGQVVIARITHLTLFGLMSPVSKASSQPSSEEQTMGQENSVSTHGFEFFFGLLAIIGLLTLTHRKRNT